MLSLYTMRLRALHHAEQKHVDIQSNANLHVMLNSSMLVAQMAFLLFPPFVVFDTVILKQFLNIFNIQIIIAFFS